MPPLGLTEAGGTKSGTSNGVVKGMTNAAPPDPCSCWSLTEADAGGASTGFAAIVLTFFCVQTNCEEAEEDDEEEEVATGLDEDDPLLLLLLLLLLSCCWLLLLLLS